MLAKSKSHLILIGIGTFLSAFSLGCIIKFTDPYSGGSFTHLFFYLSLFMVTLGVCVLIGLSLRVRFAPGLYVNHLAGAFRQAIFLSFLITASLLLQAKGLLFWWVGITLFLFFLSVEVFINTK